MTRAALLVSLLAVAVAAAGCSSSAGDQAQSATSAPAPTTTADPGTALRGAARKALLAHHGLSVRVLWTNTVPTKPLSVGGTALRALREAARDRQKRGVRVRVVKEDFRIVSLRLDPSYASATAVVVDRQTGAIYEHGRRAKRQINLNERARVQLRRSDRTSRFVVWKVVLL